ncbi:MAG: hypothetical protein JXP36_06245 [Bacteroidales bacterium]|nr:hypothetical protein [Bacteroidales bacterium]
MLYKSIKLLLPLVALNCNLANGANYNIYKGTDSAIQTKWNPNVYRSVRIRNDTLLIKPRWFMPDHYMVQYAGGIGFLSIGAGYNLWDWYEPTLLIGYVNETFGNSSKAVTTLSIKNSFILFRKYLPEPVKLRGGISVNTGYTNNTFRRLPPHYPEKYYFQNKVFLSPFLGGEWQFKFNRKHLKTGGLFFEFNTRDAYLLECLRTDYVKFHKIWNLGLGITFYLE